MVYSRATQLVDHGPISDLSSVETGPEAPGCVTAGAATGREKNHVPFTKLC